MSTTAFLELRLAVGFQHGHGRGVKIHGTSAAMRLRFAELHVVVDGLTGSAPTSLMTRSSTGGRRHRDHAAGLDRGELGGAEGTQCARVELPKRAPQLVHLPLPGPDQVLVRSGEHLDRLGELTVTGELPVVAPVGADQIGQHLRIAGSDLARLRDTECCL